MKGHRWTYLIPTQNFPRMRFWSEVGNNRKKGKIHVKKGNEYAKKQVFKTLADIFLFLWSHFSFQYDFWIFSKHVSIVGFKEILSVHVKPRYLNFDTVSNIRLFLWISAVGLLTEDWNICTTVLAIFTGCFQRAEYSNRFWHTWDPSLFINLIISCRFLRTGGTINVLRSSVNKWVENAFTLFVKSAW